MTAARAAAVFFAFAFGYFVSALLRAVTATLAPVLTVEFVLNAADLGLLGGAYFAGFALLQLPLGHALDRIGPRRVQLALLGVAMLGCATFALAGGFVQLVVARMLIGAGVAACLMAPLTAYRRLFEPGTQLRANAWMLMSGSMGMLASTLPVQWLLPAIGWRGMFWASAVMLGAALALAAWLVPHDAPRHDHGVAPTGYGGIVSQPTFVRMLPLAFFMHAGTIAMQTLWAGPWLTEVTGQSPDQAAGGLFVINLGMLLAFAFWGAALPRLKRAGWDADRLIAITWPIGVGLLLLIVVLGPNAGAICWALWCVSVSAVTLAQPMVAQAFPSAQAGRVLSAFNLAIFVGVFVLQWGIGLSIDGLRAWGWSTLAAYRATFALFALGCVLSGLWFVWRAPQRRQRALPGPVHG